MKIPEMGEPFRGGIAIMIHGAGYRRAMPLFIWLLDIGDEEDAARRIPFDLRGWELIAWSAELSGGSSSDDKGERVTQHSVYPFAT